MTIAWAFSASCAGVALASSLLATWPTRSIMLRLATASTASGQESLRNAVPPGPVAQESCNQAGNIPQGLKALSLSAFCGTAEALPFQDPICATSSSVVSLKSTAFLGKGNRRSFDFVWPKSRPNSAQDDSGIYAANFRDMALGTWSIVLTLLKGAGHESTRFNQCRIACCRSAVILVRNPSPSFHN
jgi:hypothetical protein